MSLSVLFHTPYYTGTSITPDVPGVFDVAIGGRGYMIDKKKQGQFGRQSIPLVRDQGDASLIFGEHSINPEELWRVAQDNWTHGAGQTYLDRADPNTQIQSNRGSDLTRFRSSKGINPWTRWQLSLLNDTLQIASSANTNLALAPVGTYWYYTDGTTIAYKTTLTAGAGTSVTGGPATAASSIASDGFNVWTAHGANGIYATTRGGATTASYATGNVSIVAYVSGRLMAAYQDKIYNVTTGGALPAALLDHANSDFTWVGFAEGPQYIYAAGYSGDKSLIYKTTIKADGTALDVPSVAGTLPDGEIVRSIQGVYGQFLEIGTDKGVRTASFDGGGNLNLGALIPTNAPVYAFEPQENYCWFSWTNYDATSTGLGRLNLQQADAGGPNVPAYASDLMVTGQGTVTSIGTFNNKRIFSVSGLGIYTEDTTLVSSGTMDSGYITYGLPDYKVGMYLDATYQSLAGTVRAWVAPDSGTFSAVGFDSTAGNTGLSSPVGQLKSHLFEVRIELDRDTTTTGPTFSRYTFRAVPAPTRNEIATVPLLLFDNYKVLGGTDRYLSPLFEFQTILEIIQARAVVTYQDGSLANSAFIDDYQWEPDFGTNKPKDGFWNGTMTVRLKVLNQ